MQWAALIPLGWAAIVSVLMCAFSLSKQERTEDVTKAEFVAARLFMFGGGLIGLLVILWQAAKIIKS